MTLPKGWNLSNVDPLKGWRIEGPWCSSTSEAMASFDALSTSGSPNPEPAPESSPSSCAAAISGTVSPYFATIPAWPRYVTPADKDQTITRLCKLLSEAWNQYDPDAHGPNDCFCGHGGFKNAKPENWRSSAQALTWVETLVRNALATVGPDAADGSGQSGGGT